MDADSMPDSLPSLEMSNPSTMETFGDPSDEPIEIPSENDVLCGRGGSINSHKGNEQFRELVEKRKRVYLTARFKREKRLIASSIVAEIRAMNPPGRFLARKGNKDTGFWYDIGDEKARDKTSQALRENAPTIRAVIETEINEQRAEMKRKEVEQFPPNPAPSYDATAAHPYYAHAHAHPHVPPHPPAHQSYWDWYHHYYGYPPPAHMPPPHYPPPPPHAAMAAPLIPIVIPAHPAAPHEYWGQPVVPTAAGRKRDGEEFKDDSSDDEIDQEEEDHRLAMELQQQEKAALYEARKSRYKNTLANRSNAHLGSASTRPQGVQPQRPVAKKPPPSFQDMDATDLTQEELDHRLALALQEEEDKALRQHIATVDRGSRKTSRSNACFQAPRARRKESMSSDNSSSFGPFDFPASFVAWMNNDSSGRSKPTAQRRRSVQFKDDDMTSPLIPHQPGNVQRQSSTASADRPLHSQAEQNTSLLSQVANHIIGSWENLGGSHTKTANDSHDDHMETEGLEVQLRDPHDETSLPSPSPRVQIDWSSRIDGGQSWIPDSFNTNWGNSNNSLSGSTHAGISSVNSLDMDTSGNQGSLGGASLCQLFDQDESMQRALREVPSWERSMRSKSPLSMASAEETDMSLIRVRELKLFRAAATHIRRSSSGEMDWDNNPEDS